MSAPRNNIEPRSGFSVFINSRSRVLLPMPLGPRSTRHSPRRISRLRSLKIILAPKCSVTPLISTRQPLPFSFTKYRTSLYYTPEVRVAHHSLRQSKGPPLVHNHP